MLSRVADSLFWLGRYLERAENYARFIEVNFNLSMDLPPGVKEQWAPLIATSGDLETFQDRYSDYTKRDVIYFLAFDDQYENSIFRSVKKARENARITRENISREAWETINSLYYHMKTGIEKKIWKLHDPRKFFQTIKDKVQVIYGLAYHAESRTEGWYFNKMGMYLERADKTSRILDVKYHILLPSLDQVGTPIDYIHWAALLKSVSAFNAYKHVYGKVAAVSVLEFLLLDKFFPRSVFFCLNAAERQLRILTGTSQGFSNEPEKSFGALRSELEFTDIQKIVSFGVHEFIDQLQIHLNDISVDLSNQYFKAKSNFVQQTSPEG